MILIQNFYPEIRKYKSFIQIVEEIHIDTIFNEISTGLRVIHVKNKSTTDRVRGKEKNYLVGSLWGQILDTLTPETASLFEF